MRVFVCRGNLEEAAKWLDKAMDYSRSHQELVMLCSLLRAANIQLKVKSKLIPVE